jgi:hypothetical protein
MTETTGAARFNTTKFRPSLVPASLVRYCAYGMTYGAVKYEDNNWRKGFDWTSIMDSFERHFLAIKEGEDIDEESGLPHLSLLACNLAFLVEHYDTGLGRDDRFQYSFDFARQQLAFKDPPKKLKEEAAPLAGETFTVDLSKCPSFFHNNSFLVGTGDQIQ